MTAVALLHRTFPCCGGKSRVAADCAKEVYARRCGQCGTTWTVRRTTRPASPFSRQLGIQVDSLEWERVTK